MAGRPHAYVLSAAMLGAVLYPVLGEPSDDGYPLSTYPMFARERPRTASVTSALALGAGGFERAVPPGYVATSEAMQALVTLRKAVDAGPQRARALCRDVAERLARSDDAAFAQATEVALVTQTVDSIAYLSGERQALARRVHARCRLPRAAP